MRETKIKCKFFLLLYVFFLFSFLLFHELAIEKYWTEAHTLNESASLEKSEAAVVVGA